MGKENLNHENIIKDLIQLNKHTVKWGSLLFAIVFLLLLIISSQINGSLFSNPAILAVASALLLIWLIFWVTYVIKIKKAKNIQFKVVTAKLIGKNLKRSGINSIRFSEPYSLEFALYGKWRIYLSTNYLWTKYAQFSDEAIYNNSIIGDEFYLVVDSKDAILVAYNSRFFEF